MSNKKDTLTARDWCFAIPLVIFLILGMVKTFDITVSYFQERSIKMRLIEFDGESMARRYGIQCGEAMNIVCPYYCENNE